MSFRVFVCVCLLVCLFGGEETQVLVCRVLQKTTVSGLLIPSGFAMNTLLLQAICLKKEFFFLFGLLNMFLIISVPLIE